MNIKLLNLNSKFITMRTKGILIIVTLLFVNFTAFAQQIPNSNFETWTDTYNAEGWNSLNLEVSIFNFHSAEQSTDVEEGIYSAKLTSGELLGQFIPGLITLGEIDIENQSIGGGIPFGERPTGLCYFFKYLPEGNDTTYMISLLTKWNEATENTDTIGMTAYFTSNETSAYTQVNVPYIYNSEEIPDTLNVIFLSSGFTGTVGSTLLVDNVSMLYTDVIISPTFCFSATDTAPFDFTTDFMDIPNAVSYKLDVAHDANFTNFLTIYENWDIGLNTSYYVGTIVQPSLYFYRVRVNYGTEISMNSNTIAVPLPTLSLDATEVASNSFKANWGDPINTANYYIDVATDIDFQSFVSGYENLYVNDGTISLLIENLNVETEYFYRVRVEYENGDYLSENSNTVSVNTTVSINDIISENIKVYSENNTIVILTETQSLPNKIVVYNIQGKEVKSISNPKGKEIVFVKNAGMYIVNLQYDDFVVNKKVVR